MLFQTIDNKEGCSVIYADGNLHNCSDNLELTHTWAPSSGFINEKIEYASAWASCASLDDICPDHLKGEWENVNKKMKYFLISLHQSKINLNDICLYEAIPRRFILMFYEIKNKLTQWVFDNYQRPENYEFIRNLLFFLKKIENSKLNLDFQNLDWSDDRVRKNLNKIKNSSRKIMYNPWGTTTGRLTTSKDSFPILTLNKELRSVLKPNNDLFVEFDYNSAELRVLLGLLDRDQPKEDIHSWVNKNIFDNKYDRDKTKKKIFSWLYNTKAKNKKLNKYFDRDKVSAEYWRNSCVETCFHRKIPADRDHALNYIIQSTTSDLFLTSAMEIDKMLNNRRSFISFCIHDSLVIDFAKEDRDVIDDLIKSFSHTRFGEFKTNLSIGRDFGHMKRIA